MIRLEDAGIDASNSILSISSISPSYVFEFENIYNISKTIMSSGHRTIPVVTKENEILGIVTYMDILDAILKGLTRNSQVSSFMTRKIISCESSDSIRTILQKIKFSKRGNLPVLNRNKLVGMIGERDFLELFASKYFGKSISQIMTHKPFFVQGNSTIFTTMKAMVNTHYRRFPVVEKGSLVGVVTGGDILRFLVNENFNMIKLHLSIDEIMSTPAKHISMNADMSDALKMMIDEKISGLPVLDDDSKMVGVVTERDVIEKL